jgi:hypothetical protein
MWKQKVTVIMGTTRGHQKDLSRASRTKKSQLEARRRSDALPGAIPAPNLERIKDVNAIVDALANLD